MAVADLITALRTRTKTAKQSAKELAVSIVEGVSVKDVEIEAACREAGLSLEDFATLLSKLETRKAAFDDFHSRDFDAEISACLTEYRKNAADIEAVTAEIVVLQTELKRLSSLQETNPKLRQRLAAEKKAAREALTAALGDTPDDWRNI